MTVEIDSALSHLGLPITRGNVQTVLQKSQVYDDKNWQSTLRCFSLPAVNIEEGLSPSQKTQYLSESCLENEQHFQWWKLGMKLIRCCRAKEVETIQDLMTNVATYNRNSKSPCLLFSTKQLRLVLGLQTL